MEFAFRNYNQLLQKRYTKRIKPYFHTLDILLFSILITSFHFKMLTLKRISFMFTITLVFIIAAYITYRIWHLLLIMIPMSPVAMYAVVIFIRFIPCFSVNTRYLVRICWTWYQLSSRSFFLPYYRNNFDRQ